MMEKAVPLSLAVLDPWPARTWDRRPLSSATLLDLSGKSLTGARLDPIKENIFKKMTLRDYALHLHYQGYSEMLCC